MIQIDKNVPIPPLREATKYPFPAMEIGDSFAVEAEVAKSARVIAAQYGRRHNKKFVGRKEDGGRVRIWRAA